MLIGNNPLLRSYSRSKGIDQAPCERGSLNPERNSRSNFRSISGTWKHRVSEREREREREIERERFCVCVCERER